MSAAEMPQGRERGGGPRGGRRHARVCRFCVDKVEHINYKDLGRLREMVTEHGKIKTRRMTSNCAAHQRQVARAIKRARHMALLPYVAR